MFISTHLCHSRHAILHSTHCKVESVYSSLLPRVHVCSFCFSIFSFCAHSVHRTCSNEAFLNLTLGSSGYTQAWLRGDELGAHVHEGLRLEGGDGWVGVGQTLEERRRQVMVRMIDNEGTTVWTRKVGDSHTTTGQTSYSTGFSIAQVRRM